ncbi:MAG TPA: glycosyltransferase family 39 protein, partial [Anaerolineae bacterium]
MRKLRPYAWLFAMALAYRILIALPLERAGYMDASYTVHVAQQIAAGRGLAEFVLWNYLDQPQSLPHPSNLYWLPLPALLTAPFFALLGVNIHAAQTPFILLSSILPLIAFYLARRMFQRDAYAWMAGLLTIFSGFYTIYWVAPDNFAPFALTTSLALIFIANGLYGRNRNWLLAGLFIGLSNLSRADGILLLGVVPLTLWFLQKETGWRFKIAELFLVIVGYALVSVPWFGRNVIAIGSPLPPGSLQTMFLREYSEFFRFHVEDLTLARYIEQGPGPIIQSKASAL